MPHVAERGDQSLYWQPAATRSTDGLLLPAQANQVGHLICNCCQITLMYAWGAQSVKCAVCNHITPINASTSAGPAPPPNPSGLP